jgi:hypothetical protein
LRIRKADYADLGARDRHGRVAKKAAAILFGFSRQCSPLPPFGGRVRATPDALPRDGNTPSMGNSAAAVIRCRKRHQLLSLAKVSNGAPIALTSIAASKSWFAFKMDRLSQLEVSAMSVSSIQDADVDLLQRPNSAFVPGSIGVSCAGLMVTKSRISDFSTTEPTKESTDPSYTNLVHLDRGVNPKGCSDFGKRLFSVSRK